MSPGIHRSLEHHADALQDEALYTYLDSVFTGSGNLVRFLLGERTSAGHIGLDKDLWNPKNRTVTLHTRNNLKNLESILSRRRQVFSRPDVFAAFVYDFLAGVSAYVRAPYDEQKMQCYLESIPINHTLLSQAAMYKDIKYRKALLRSMVPGTDEISQVAFPQMARPEVDPRYLSSFYLMCLFQRCYALLPKRDDLIRSLES